MRERRTGREGVDDESENEIVYLGAFRGVCWSAWHCVERYFFKSSMESQIEIGHWALLVHVRFLLCSTEHGNLVRLYGHGLMLELSSSCITIE
jgi:hypothetical protein